MKNSELKQNLERRFRALENANDTKSFLVAESDYLNFLVESKQIHNQIQTLLDKDHEVMSYFVKHFPESSKIPKFLEKNLIREHQERMARLSLGNNHAIQRAWALLDGETNRPVWKDDFDTLQTFNSSLLETIPENEKRNKFFYLHSNGDLFIKGKRIISWNPESEFAKFFKVVYEHADHNGIITDEEIAEILKPMVGKKVDHDYIRAAYHRFLEAIGLQNNNAPDGKPYLERKRNPSRIIFHNPEIG